MADALFMALSSSREQRKPRKDPQTPNIKLEASKRMWASTVRRWRRALHMYDPSEAVDDGAMMGAEDDDADDASAN